MSLGFENSWLEQHLRDVEGNNSIIIVSSTEEPAVAPGDNYLSSITRLKLTIRVAEKDSNEEKSLIVKNLPESDLAKKVEKIMNAFKKEIITYRDILHKFDGLKKSLNEKSESVWATMVACKPYHLLILEDLKTKGFKSLDRRIPLDLDHGLLVMKGFGSFHAYGALELKKGSIETEPISDYFFSTDFVIGVLYKKIVHTLSRAITETWGIEGKKLGHWIREHYQDLGAKILDLYTNYNRKFSVVNHGDLWIPNTMFKYDEKTQKPTAVKFLDFQFTHHNSFAWDISLFLFGAMNPTVRRKHWLELLKVYQISLHENMKLGGMSVEDIPTLEEVCQEMNRLKFMTPLILALQFGLSISKEGDYEFEKVMGEPDNLDRGVNFSLFDEEFKNYVLDDLKDLFSECESL